MRRRKTLGWKTGFVADAHRLVVRKVWFVVYQVLFIQGRGELRRELTACLRTGRVLRVPRARTRRRGNGFVSPEIMISQRPAEAAELSQDDRRTDAAPQPSAQTFWGPQRHLTSGCRRSTKSVLRRPFESAQ